MVAPIAQIGALRREAGRAVVMRTYRGVETWPRGGRGFLRGGLGEQRETIKTFVFEISVGEGRSRLVRWVKFISNLYLEILLRKCP